MEPEDQKIRRRSSGKNMPVAEKSQMEKIVDRRIGKKTRRKTYFEYLVKWKGHPIEDDAGASPTKHVWRTVGHTSMYFEVFLNSKVGILM
jgi:hypothetical protein